MSLEKMKSEQQKTMWCMKIACKFSTSTPGKQLNNFAIAWK